MFLLILAVVVAVVMYEFQSTAFDLTGHYNVSLQGR